MKRSGFLQRKTPMRRSRFEPAAEVERTRVMPTPSTLPRPRAVIAAIADALVPAPKSPTVKSVAYLRLVAALPCIRCGRIGRSQAAHPNTGKAAGKKLVDDRLTFPLCCGNGFDFLGCHEQFDQHALYPKEERRRLEVDWALQTIAEICRQGLWPKNLELPEIWKSRPRSAWMDPA